MTKIKTREQRQEAYKGIAGQVYEELENWYDEHPDASYGEIEAEARKRRRDLMGETMRILVNERDTGYQWDGVSCGKGGGEMKFKGYRGWGVHGLEGDTRLERAYYVCPNCEGETVFPPGSQVEVESRSLE